MKNNFVYPSDIGLHKFPSAFTVSKNAYVTVDDYCIAWMDGIPGDDCYIYDRFKKHINESAQNLVNQWYRQKYKKTINEWEYDNAIICDPLGDLDRRIYNKENYIY